MQSNTCFFSMRHFGHFSIKHFGHLSHCCMKFAATVFISLHLQTSWPKSPNFFGRFKNILVCDRKKENNSNHRCAAANRGWICCAWFLISALLSKLHLKALVFLYAFRGISRLPLQSVCYGFELVLRNFDCSLEFVFSLLLLQPFNFSPVSFACKFSGLRMRTFTWNQFPIKNVLIDSLLTSIVESTYLHTEPIACTFSRNWSKHYVSPIALD